MKKNRKYAGKERYRKHYRVVDSADDIVTFDPPELPIASTSFRQPVSRGVADKRVFRETHTAVIEAKNLDFAIRPLTMPASHLAKIREMAKRNLFRWDANFVQRGLEANRLCEALSRESVDDEDLDQSRARFIEFLRKGRGATIKFRPLSETVKSVRSERASRIIRSGA